MVTVLNLVVASFIDGFSNLYEDPAQKPRADDDMDLEGAESEGKHAEGAEYESKIEHEGPESRSEEELDPEGDCLTPSDPEGAVVDPEGPNSKALQAVVRPPGGGVAGVTSEPDTDNTAELDAQLI